MKTQTKGDRTRILLLEAAIRCIGRKGWEGATYSELAKEANVDRALFVRYFGDKESLTDRCLAHVSTAFRAETLGFIDELQEMGPMDSVETYYRATFLWLRRCPDHAAFLFLVIQRAAYDYRFKEYIMMIFNRGWEGIIERLDKDQTLRGLSPADPMDFARQIHQILTGGILLALVDPKADVDGHERRCISIAQHIIGSERNPR